MNQDDPRVRWGMPMPEAQWSPPDRTGRGGSLRPLVDRRADQHRVETITDVAPAQLSTCLRAALMGGIGVLLSPTSDGGAVSVTAYAGRQRSRSYCADREEYADALQALADLGGANGVSVNPAPTRTRKVPQ